MHIFGASGHTKVILDILEELHINISGIWDDNPNIKTFKGHEVKGGFAAFEKIQAENVIIAIGNNAIRKRIAASVSQNSVLAIHPKAYVSNAAIIGIGTVVMANATINADANIGKYAIINTNASVDHDCILGDYVHISPQAGLAGNVIVGEGTHVGIGASIKQGVKIGKWVTIGAGAVIVRDIPDYAVVVGNPGRIIKYNNTI